MVQCPVCEREIPMSLINKHLDSECEEMPQEKEKTTSSGAPVASIFQNSQRTPGRKNMGGGIHNIGRKAGSGSGGGNLGFGGFGSGSGNLLAVGHKRSRPEGIFGSEGGMDDKEEMGSVSTPVTPLKGRRDLDFPPSLSVLQETSSLSEQNAQSAPPPPAKKQKTATERMRSAMPLAEKARPQVLDEICGQELVGKDGILRGLIEKERVPSMILWGTAGCGKTTIARVIAKITKSRFIEISATDSGVTECKKIFTEAKSELALTGRKTILFCDEIHRFSKTQQDVFLTPVENGQITLIGATTENPSFKVQSALLSRCRVFTLEKLTTKDIEYILRRAIALEMQEKAIEEGEYEAKLPQILDNEMLGYLALFADGDARTALNLLELAMSLSGREGYTKENVKKALTRTMVYDRSGDMHFDAISAFHKSVRGSDPDAALYWLGRMLKSGEDPLYIARRMVVIASEDVGLADNTMLPLATAAYTAVQQVGLPEARINLAHAAVALSLAKKSIRTYRGLSKVEEDLERDPIAAGAPVPYHLRNAPTRLMKDLGYGKEYKYNPDYKDGEVDQEYLPEQLRGRKYFEDLDLGTKIDQDLYAKFKPR